MANRRLAVREARATNRCRICGWPCGRDETSLWRKVAYCTRHDCRPEHAHVACIEAGERNEPYVIRASDF